MDARGQFNPGSKAKSSAKFANNTLYWPMKVVVDCPLSTSPEKTLCRNALLISARRREIIWYIPLVRRMHFRLSPFRDQRRHV
jgi:hypothetical protein